MAKKFEYPNLENATPEMLIDEMGKLSVMESYVKKMRAYYKEAYYSKMGIDPKAPLENLVTQSGELFIGETSQYPAQIVDQEKVKMIDDWFTKFGKTNTITVTRFTLNPGVVNPMVNDLIDQLKKELDLD
jgi:hypothetical protein